MSLSRGRERQNNTQQQTDRQIGCPQFRAYAQFVQVKGDLERINPVFQLFKSLQTQTFNSICKVN